MKQLRHLGYVAIALALQATTNRTCRLRNATPQRLRELIGLNLRDLFRVLQYNVQNDIYLYRISSQIIPFASHPVNQIRWWEEYDELFAQMAAFIAAHNLRVSMHPGQFTVLNSPKPEIVTASVEELRWHGQFLEALGTDKSHKLVIHIGGAYGEKAAAAARFVRVAKTLPDNLRQRLIVENDERSYTAREVWGIARRTGLPVVFDWLHHQVNPGPDGDVTGLLEACFDTWRPQDGLPKVHYSSPAPSGAAHHDDWVDAGGFQRFLDLTPDRPFDVMLEAKKKDLALLRLRQELRGRGIAESAA